MKKFLFALLFVALNVQSAVAQESVLFELERYTFEQNNELKSSDEMNSEIISMDKALANRIQRISQKLADYDTFAVKIALVEQHIFVILLDSDGSVVDAMSIEEALEISANAAAQR